MDQYASENETRMGNPSEHVWLLYGSLAGGEKRGRTKSFADQTRLCGALNRREKPTDR